MVCAYRGGWKYDRGCRSVVSVPRAVVCGVVLPLVVPCSVAVILADGGPIHRKKERWQSKEEKKEKEEK